MLPLAITFQHQFLKPITVLEAAPLRSAVSATVLTEENAVAGFYCDAIGPHGDTRSSRPFVWKGGKLSWLPLGKFKFGRVFGGRGSTLVGELRDDDDPVPAKWTADPRLGWAKARLTQLSSEPEYGTAVSSNGDVWVQASKTLTRISGSGRTNYVCPATGFVGLDGQNRIWWNRWDPGVLSPNPQVVFYEASQLKTPSFKLFGFAVNDRGDLCGTDLSSGDSSTYEVSVVLCGKLSKIPLPKNRFSRAMDINDRGEVVGYFNNFGTEAGILDVQSGVARLADGTVMRTEAFLFSKGRLTLLRVLRPDCHEFEPDLINNSGTVIGHTARGIFLVRTR